MTPAPNIAILLMAAGSSQRMGRDKLLLEHPSGVTLLEDRIAVSVATGLPVYVALGSDQPKRAEVVGATRASVLLCRRAENGLGHNLAQAMSGVATEFDAVLICLADMPALTTDDLRKVCAGFDRDTISQGATTEGTPGHPVLFPAKFWPELLRLSGDTGAKEVLQTAPRRLVPLPNDHATFDVDTPEDWESWLSRWSALL